MGLFDRLSPAFILSPEETLSKALGELSRQEGCVVVMKGFDYAGIVSDRLVEDFSSDPATTKLSAVAAKAPLIAYGSGIADVCAAFFDGPYNALPVERDGKIAGVISRVDVVRELAEQGALNGSVAEYMTSPAVQVPEGSTIAQARAKMMSSGVRRLVVTGDGKIRGLVSMYDLKVKALIPKERMPMLPREKHGDEDALISQLMVQGDEVATVPPGATLAEAARRMVSRKVSALVVAEDGAPVGIVSARDIFESIMHAEATPVYLSGLGREERMEADEIRSDVERKAEKISRSLGIDYVALHFKKYGHKHSIHARLKLSRGGVIVAHNHGFELRGTLHGLLDELEKIALKGKNSPIHSGKPGGA
jgi:CBS domain-containing protein